MDWQVGRKLSSRPSGLMAGVASSAVIAVPRASMMQGGLPGALNLMVSKRWRTWWIASLHRFRCSTMFLWGHDR